jgi:hypothetical protein
MTAREGRRRVKEQLKKMGSFEYYQTSFSYIVNETGEEHFVGVPEQGGRDLISPDPLPPGTIYSASVGPDGTVGLYRFEVAFSAGKGKLKPVGALDRPAVVADLVVAAWRQRGLIEPVQGAFAGEWRAVLAPRLSALRPWFLDACGWRHVRRDDPRPRRNG